MRDVRLAASFAITSTQHANARARAKKCASPLSMGLLFMIHDP